MISNPGNGSRQVNSIQSSPLSEMATERTVGVRACPLCGGLQTSDFLTAPDRFHLRQEKYNLARCSFCSCVWLSNPPMPETMELHYTKSYHKAIEAGAPAHRCKMAKPSRHHCKLHARRCDS